MTLVGLDWMGAPNYLKLVLEKVNGFLIFLLLGLFPLSNLPSPFRCKSSKMSESLGRFSAGAEADEAGGGASGEASADGGACCDWPAPSTWEAPCP